MGVNLKRSQFNLKSTVYSALTSSSYPIIRYFAWIF